MKSNRKLISRFDTVRGRFEVGYWQGTSFVIINYFYV